MSVPSEILDLVERFERQLEAYKSGQYNETQLRREFLDPLFKALGWDLDNTAGYAEAYKDVIHEDQIRVGGAVKAPDYCFRIGGTRKFFLEAKKPSVFIKEEIPPAYQLRRYAWSAKLPLSILSDFEEFAIYDCRIRPDKNDKASAGRIFYCTFRDYSEKWDYIASIFSRDAVLKGSFDKFAETNKAKRGTAEVDAAFLEEIERWRKGVTIHIENSGEVLIRLLSGFSWIQQVTLVANELSERTEAGADFVEANATEAQWPLLGERNFAFAKPGVEIEPGESDELHAEFMIPLEIKRILVYTHLENTKKRPRLKFWKNRTIGWNLSTVYSCDSPTVDASKQSETDMNERKPTGGTVHGQTKHIANQQEAKPKPLPATQQQIKQGQPKQKPPPATQKPTKQK